MRFPRKPGFWGTAFFVLALSTCVAAYAQTGDIQVTSDAGVRVYLDDHFQGVTKSDVDGLYLEDVAVGSHAVRAEKNGFPPRSFAVHARANVAVEVIVGRFTPKLRIEQEGDSAAGGGKAKVGRLEIRSVPVGCTISFAGETITKEKDWVYVSDLAEGSYPIVFSRPAGTLRTVLQVHGGVLLRVLAHFPRGEITVEEVAAETALEGFRSEGFVFLPVTPGGSTRIDGKSFPVDPFYIAKHETTYGRYDAFVQAGNGFEVAEWWRDMPAEYSPPIRELDGQINGLLAAPRDEVSWYQAVAFTRWLNARMAAKKEDVSSGGLLVNGVEWEVRLPAEWEWQWAAQGGAEEREHPWGDWQDGHANTTEAGVDGTTVVGSFPLGAAASGAMDMSGNVWEWCLNKADSPHEITVGATQDERVLRGGSFDFSGESIVPLVRFRHTPDSTWNGSGFRVGLFPPQ